MNDKKKCIRIYNLDINKSKLKLKKFFNNLLGIKQNILKFLMKILMINISTMINKCNR